MQWLEVTETTADGGNGKGNGKGSLGDNSDTPWVVLLMAVWIDKIWLKSE